MSEETHLIIFEYEPLGRNRELVHTSTYDIHGILSDGSELRILQSFPPPAFSTNINNLTDTWDEFESTYLTRPAPGFICSVEIHSLAPQDSEIVAGLKERLAITHEKVIYMNQYTFKNSAGTPLLEIMSSKEKPSVDTTNVKLHSEFERFLSKQLHVPQIIRRGEYNYDVFFAYKLRESDFQPTMYTDMFAKGVYKKSKRNKKSTRNKKSKRNKSKKVRS